MFKEYDPTEERDTDCKFLLSRIGDGSFEEIRKHVKDCADCRFEVERDYYFYKSGRYPDLFPGVPLGLVVDEFFSVQHLVLKRRLEVNEHYMLRLEDGVMENYAVVFRLIRTIHRITSLKARQAPQVLMENDYKLLESCYRNLLVALGTRETYLFLDLKEDKDGENQFEQMLAHWKVVLGVGV